MSEFETQIPARWVVDTAISVYESFYDVASAPPVLQPLVGEIRGAVDRLEIDWSYRDRPLIEQDPRPEVVRELDELLASWRASAADAFRPDPDSPETYQRTLGNQIIHSAEWQLLLGIPLSTCDDPNARMTIRLQDLKYQLADAFHDDVAHLDNCRSMTSLLLFGNGAIDSDFTDVDFARFEQLEFLNLAQNRLTSLPRGIPQHSTLRCLSLAQNPRIELDAVAEQWDTPRLELLDLTGSDASTDFERALRAKHPNLIIWRGKGS